jgi:competence protein ComGC
MGKEKGFTLIELLVVIAIIDRWMLVTLASL